MNFTPQNQPQLPNNRKVHAIFRPTVLNPENDQQPDNPAKLSFQISPRISEDEKILEKARTAEVHKLVVCFFPCLDIHGVQTPIGSQWQGWSSIQ